MKIVTGYRGEPHITSNDDQARNQGIFGSGNYVLKVGGQLELSQSGNVITIADGDGMLQGVHFRILPGQTESVTIDTAGSGHIRQDYICARYTKDSTTGIEDVSLVVLKGTPVAYPGSDPTIPPDYYTGDVLAGDSPVDFPLYDAIMEENTLDGYHQTMFEVLSPLSE